VTDTPDNIQRKTLVVVTGPTGSGKSSLAVALAQHLGCDIINADSRQIYQGIPIGTAAPTPEQLAAVRHHFVATLPLEAYYSAAQFETDVLALLPRLWQQSDYAVMCGGSMMYIDAVTRGIDDIPTISEQVRADVMQLYQQGGLQQLRLQLLQLDPVYYREVDLNNHRRLIHAIEICLQSGKRCSDLRTGQIKQRPFRIVQMAINYSRDDLFNRINTRVDKMLADGLVDEARSVIALRQLNSLNTVGYKEMFTYLDGTWDLPTATARMAKNTRVYAKKQLTWLKTRPETILLDPYSTTSLLSQALIYIMCSRNH
jgi:tRNA dimethylallyltransferase